MWRIPYQVTVALTYLPRMQPRRSVRSQASVAVAAAVAAVWLVTAAPAAKPASHHCLSRTCLPTSNARRTDRDIVLLWPCRESRWPRIPTRLAPRLVPAHPSRSHVLRSCYGTSSANRSSIPPPFIVSYINYVANGSKVQPRKRPYRIRLLDPVEV